ncbi:MAG: Dam family site-specific DNA-(adenine-N6)-methyltransferase [Candidatus Coatesbacteria bacterium]|nr:Dam family site-specific DNA-(adenine-N6)-methyltransferase [Candidatus Coatesbacteria bacterium]
MSTVKVPPIKCQGIKTKLVPWIKYIIDWNDDGIWYEPFMGSGVVGFNIAPKKAIFSDINPHIIQLYNEINNDHITPSVVRSFLEGEGNKLHSKGEDYYYQVRERFNKYYDPLDLLFLSRSCFNGIMRFNKSGKFNTPFCKKVNRFRSAYITKITNQIRWLYSLMKIRDWQFIVSSYESILGKTNICDFVYLDPPYHGRYADYYTKWTLDNENKLYSILTNIKSKFLLSTWYKNKYRTNEIAIKYEKSFNILKRKHFYHIGGYEENRNEMIEALIANFEPNEGYEKKKVCGLQLSILDN